MREKRTAVLLATLLAVACSNHAGPPASAEELAVADSCPRVLPAPHLLPGSRPEHRDPGFWISRMESPDALVLDPDEITALNRRALGLAPDSAGLGARYRLLEGPGNPEPIVRRMQAALDHHRQRAADGHRVTLEGARPSSTFFERLQEIQGSFERVRSFHLVSRLTELRCHPTEEGLYEYEGDVDFDMLLCSTARPGEVVRVLSEHRGGWALVRTGYATGWVRQRHIGPELSEEAVVELTTSEPFVVVTGDRVPVWRTPQRRQQLTTVRLGLRMPLRGTETARLRRVLAPSDAGLVEGYIDTAEVHEGYLPLTRRNVVDHGFARLDDVFGWAGDGGDRDCSRFFMDLFALFGLQLPRNSHFQSRSTSFAIDTSEMTSSLERRAALDRSLTLGVALVYMPGHIMLLLGRDGENYHAIHQFSGYRIGCESGRDIKLAVDRLSVTTLQLGETSERRSFMERFTSIAVLGHRSAPPATDQTTSL